ncbi:MAG: ferrous iron transport protein B [Acidobacteriales bacterium]|nr:ferrous iron transport protein B [Terriglobales bacterium]
MAVALVGQPNCGKSTIFNQVIGYRSETANFPGSTVDVSRGQVRQNGSALELIDVPGIYSLTTSNPAEAAAKRLLLTAKVDLVINVLDSSLLSRGLELTLELMELGIPMLVCLNMMDDAERKGIAISAEKLSERLGLPVVKTVASRGLGIRELFAKVKVQCTQPAPAPPPWSRDVEKAIHGVESTLTLHERNATLPGRFIASKLLESDADLAALASAQARTAAAEARRELEFGRGRNAEAIIMGERHDGAMRIFEEVAVVGRPSSDVRLIIDDLLTHPLWGYIFLGALFLGFFWIVFGTGALLERSLQPLFAGASARISSWLGLGTLKEVLLRSVWDGVAGGATIVLPYLVPFLFGLAFLEDLGYLPRVAYLMDGLLHRIGLHGTSVLPVLLGYGCSVPACMATRILPSKRDRFIASVLATLVPCSARSNVIVALVAFYLGPAWALGIFAFNALVVILSGWILTRVWPEVSPGMVLEVPRYQLPRPMAMTRKVWFRLREFVVLSWPLLIAGSVVLALAEHWHLDRAINLAFSPLTRSLGLPLAVGTTLVFGLLRKEMSMIMLVQALGTTNISQVMSAGQIVTFTIFVMFYVPCIATIAALVKEIGRKMTAFVIGYSLLVATTLGVATRFMFAILANK